MFLTTLEIKNQTRKLWESVFNESKDFIDLYFNEKYTDNSNVFFCHDEQIFSAAQAFPMRFQMGGHVLPSIYITGLGTLPPHRQNGFATKVLDYIHRLAFKRGITFAFLVPGQGKMVDFFREEQHGGYELATCRLRKPLLRTKQTSQDIEVTEPDEYGRDVYFFHKKQSRLSPVALTLSENDFFTTVAKMELEGGALLIARHRQKIVGTCLYIPQEKNIVVHDLLVSEPAAQTAFVEYFEKTFPHQSVELIDYCKWEEEGAEPYAMARVINVEHFLSVVAAHHPNDIFEVGVEGDEFIPENNGFYRLEKGKLKLIAHRPNIVLTPGDFAAAFLREHPVEMRLLISNTID